LCFASDEYLGVKISDNYRFVIITYPIRRITTSAGPVKLITSPEYVRAFRGGLGCAKTPANYAAGLKATEVAYKKDTHKSSGWTASKENT